MGNVVEFLARVGQDASLRDDASLADALADADVSAPLRAAIEARDATGLRLLLGQDVFFSSLMPDREQEEQDDPDDGDDEDDDGDKRKKKPHRAPAKSLPG